MVLVTHGKARDFGHSLNKYSQPLPHFDFSCRMAKLRKHIYSCIPTKTR